MNYRSVYLILFFIIFTMGSYIGFHLAADAAGFFHYMGFSPDTGDSVTGWLLALTVVIAYVVSAAKISDVKKHLFAFSTLKAVAVVAALCAGIVEEIIFRKWVMDYLHFNDYSIVVQVFASALLFGIAHIFWGGKNVAAGVNAAISTTLLGFGLAVVYLAGDRSLAPCIVAHVLITALIEPGLLIAAVNNRLGYWHEKNPENER